MSVESVSRPVVSGQKIAPVRSNQIEKGKESPRSEQAAFDQLLVLKEEGTFLRRTPKREGSNTASNDPNNGSSLIKKQQKEKTVEESQEPPPPPQISLNLSSQSPSLSFTDETSFLVKGGEKRESERTPPRQHHGGFEERPSLQKESADFLQGMDLDLSGGRIRDSRVNMLPFHEEKGSTGSALFAAKFQPTVGNQSHSEQTQASENLKNFSYVAIDGQFYQTSEIRKNPESPKKQEVLFSQDQKRSSSLITGEKGGEALMPSQEEPLLKGGHYGADAPLVLSTQSSKKERIASPSQKAGSLLRSQESRPHQTQEQSPLPRGEENAVRGVPQETETSFQELTSFPSSSKGDRETWISGDPSRPMVSFQKGEMPLGGAGTLASPKFIAVSMTPPSPKRAGTLSLQLMPETLGRVEVDVRLTHDGRLDALVKTEKTETFETFQRDAQTLKQVIAEAFEVASSQMSFTLLDQGDPSHKPPHSFEDQQDFYLDKGVSQEDGTDLADLSAKGLIDYTRALDTLV